MAHTTPISSNAEGEAYNQPRFPLIRSTNAGQMPHIKAAAMPKTMNKIPALMPSVASSVIILHLVVNNIIKNATMLSTV